MKQNATNEFRDGLNLDLHPIVTPNTVLTDNLNGTFITYNGNEFCLQNDRGNKQVAKLTDGYTPIGIKEHNGILYIVSVNGNKTEIGTFPSLIEPDSLSDIDFYKEYDFEDNYKALRIGEDHSEFTNVNLGYSKETPITIEIQDSYDGTVNLILVADGIPTKIINSGFSKKSEMIGEWIKRNQTADTNIYHITDTDKLNQEINLIRTSNVLTNVDLLGVQSGGQLKGGNYTFYIKFGDADYNQTDVVAESGIVSIFNGNDGVPSTISGTLADERTDKMIHLAITGLNHVYSKIYIYYSREYSDTQGYRMTEYGMFNEPIDMIQKEDEETFESGEKGQSIWLTGFEQMVSINSEELNVDYHTIDWARAEAQHSNMLFLGNVGQKETFTLYHKLEDFTSNPLNVKTFIEQGSLVDVSDNNDSFSDKNYYSVKNIYYSLGYWPNEWYRFGIVYILNDGSTTPVFNMQGNIANNNKGVFKVQDFDILSSNKPINFRFELHNVEQLDSRIIGWFVVRQKRIPITICQGINIGIDTRCHLPLIWDGKDWVIESFLSLDRSKVYGEPYDREGRKIINASSLHILRPFIEIFDANTTLFSKTKYVVHNQTVWNVSGKKLSADDYTAWKQSAITAFDNASSRDYDENKDVIVEQDNISERYVKGDKDIHLAVYSILGIKNDDSDTYSEPDNTKLLFYFYYGNLASQFIETNNTTFYIGDVNELISGINRNKYAYRYIKESSDKISDASSGIISLDPCVNNTVSGILDGSEFNIYTEYDLTCNSDENKLFQYITPTKSENPENFNSKCVFINENTKSKVVSEDAIFSNLAGSGMDASQFERTQVTFGVKTAGNETTEKIYVKDDRVTEDYGLEDYRGYNSTHNLNLIRGLFTPYIGVNSLLSDNSVHLYSIKRHNENDNEQIVREKDNSEYYCVSSRKEIKLSNENNIQVVYRGDCYICKVGLRVLKNFIDSTAPIATTIVDPLGWETYVRQRSLYGGDSSDRENGGNDIDHKAEIADYSELNLSDLNAVDLGYWVTFPCLSSYNLGLRSVDRFHTDEMALLGSPRSFYPLSGASAVNKVGDSYLLNDGLSATVGRKRYNLMPDVPYSKSEFSNRIMFSNVNVTDAFTNGYRTFQGLAYKDYDKQYGAITKLISLGQNIFIVMEHGLGLVPVNPKALMQTTTGETIHIYGYGVLPDEMTIISQDYGSKYEHSVIRTPIGIYGVDVDAKKIWRFSDKQGFETISDMKIETYLKDNLKSQEIEMGGSDIRTHYNGKKGDLMFTWYRNGEIYSICYNERQNLWVTRYDWTPIVSENINDEFYSLNKAFIAGTEESDPIYSSDYRIWDHYYEVGWDKENKIPTHVSTWYDNDRGFEFEFVVSDPIGVSKIFENLQIISNNVSPEKLQITVIGDDYTFKRDEITPDYERKEYPDNVTWTTSNIHKNNKEYRELENTVYKWDWRLHQMAIVNTQELRDIYKHGRRLGNMQYKNGMWFIQIDPLRLNINVPQQKKEIRIRDKWAKIRIRYSGKDLAIITAIRTLINV